MAKNNDRKGVAPGFLRNSWNDANEYVAISHANFAATQELLSHAYKEICAPVFPLDHGGEPLERWAAELKNPQSDVDYRIIIAGQNLASGGAQATIKAMAVSIYYRDTDTGLLAYIVTDRQYRNEGLGHKLIGLQAAFLHAAAQENNKPLRGWFVECFDPTKTNDNYDGYDSKKLVNKYAGWDVFPVPIDYCVPDTMDKNKKIDTYMLLSGPHPQTGKYPDCKTVFAYISSIYRNLGIKNPERDPDFIAMKKELSQRKDGNTPNPCQGSAVLYKP